MLSRATLRPTLAAALALLAVGTLTGCSASDTGRLGQDQNVAASCHGKALNAIVAVDGTGSNASTAVEKINLVAITRITHQAAVCTGSHLTVFAFASSSGETATIYDSDLDASAPTENAHLRKANKLTAAATTQIANNYDQAIASLPQNGTDVIGMYRLLAEAATQRPSLVLSATILTDGLTNIGIDPTQAATNSTATALADQVNVPKLPGASITIAGLGRVAVGEIPSAQIDRLVAFYSRLCHNAHAASCTAVTDLR
jgi:hypothetical protein